MQVEIVLSCTFSIQEGIGGKSYEGTPAQHVYYRGFCGSGSLQDDVFDHLGC